MAVHGTLVRTTLTGAYLDDLRVRNYKPKTLRGYQVKLGRFTLWAIEQGKTTLASFTLALVKQYIAYLQPQHRWETSPNPRRTTQPLLSPIAIRNYVRDLKTFASWLA